jgi:hypothetical protein
LTFGVKVPWETRLGDVAEAEIKSRLCYFSILTKYERDVGIDFYCELLENDSPSIPFYVQAKGTEHFDKNWGASIRKATIHYWLNRPFPTFLIVYDENNGECYWMSIEEQRYNLFEKMSKDTIDSVYIKMDKSHILERGKEKNLDFKTKIMEGYYSIEQYHGRSPFQGSGYVKKVPQPPRSELELERTRENIRMYMYSLIIYYWTRKDPNTAAFYCKFLTQFDGGHYNHFLWYGFISKELGDMKTAKENFEHALDICERDKNWPRESMDQIIGYIKKESIEVEKLLQ